MIPLLALGGSWSPRVLWYTILEAVLETSWDFLQVAHAASAGGLPPLGLLTPVVCSNVRSGSSRGASTVIWNSFLHSGWKLHTASDFSSWISA